MSKSNRYDEFKVLPNCYRYAYGDPDLNLGLEVHQSVVLELGCGSGAYTIELAKRYPEKQFIGVDIKSDRLHFGAKRSLEEKVFNTKRLSSQVDHIDHCLTAWSIDEIWITFPDPRPWRDRQKLTSPKFQIIYKYLLKPGWVIHIKTDDKPFFDYTMKAMSSWWFDIVRTLEDIYWERVWVPWNNILPPTDAIFIQTYYEKQRLKEGRKIYYLLCHSL